jgi:hypothetical protein
MRGTSCLTIREDQDPTREAMYRVSEKRILSGAQALAPDLFLQWDEAEEATITSLVTHVPIPPLKLQFSSINLRFVRAKSLF